MIAVGLGSSSWALGISVAVFTLFSGFASSFLLVLYVRNGQVFNCESNILYMPISNFMNHGIYLAVCRITEEMDILREGLI